MHIMDIICTPWAKLNCAVISNEKYGKDDISSSTLGSTANYVT